MKKNICAVLLCTALLTSVFTACSTDQTSSDKTETATTAAATTAADTTTAANSNTTTSSSPAETTTAFPEEDTTTPIIDGVFNNGQFSMQVPQGWISDESTGIPMFVSSEAPVNGIQKNFNVTVTKEVSDPLTTTKEQYQNSLDSIYGTGVDIKKFDVSEINGNQVLCIEFSLTINEVTALVTQYAYNQNGKSLTYTYTSGNTTQPAECEEIFRSIQLV